MNAKTQAAVVAHGRHLLALFPGATVQDPVSLCRRLRRLEREGEALGLRLCNGPDISEEERGAIKERILARLDALLQYTVAGIPVFINQDPRGYALKIRNEWLEKRPEVVLHRDWGGYGILAPDLTGR